MYPSLVTVRRLALALATLLAFGVFATCTMPTALKHSLHTQGSLHPWIHLLTFAVLALLFVAGLRSNTGRLSAVAALVLFGYLTEARESRADHWPIEINDVRTDTVGVLLGSVLGLAIAAAHPRSPTALPD